jgi:cyclic pyranopterin phosphate synthase
MVDVSDKDETRRMAKASATINLTKTAMTALIEGNLKKGDALGVARIAGIIAAKKTADLIPLCHPLPITKVSVNLVPDTNSNTVVATATVKTMGQTGVEMEALTAASIAALTLYDMLKAIDKGITISAIQLIEKQGGKSGTWERTVE